MLNEERVVVRIAHALGHVEVDIAAIGEVVGAGSIMAQFMGDHPIGEKSAFELSLVEADCRSSQDRGMGGDRHPSFKPWNTSLEEADRVSTAASLVVHEADAFENFSAAGFVTGAEDISKVALRFGIIGLEAPLGA